MAPLLRRGLYIAATICVSAALVSSGQPVIAQPMAGIANAQTCVAPNRFNGRPMTVMHVAGPSQNWAHANWLPNGAPFITYGPTYFSLPPAMQIFTSMHECGHLALPTLNEFQANCYALRRLSPTPDLFNFLAVFHQSIGNLPPQYGGSGVALWNGTLAMCR